MIVGLLRSMRPHQWVKNSFVLAPLVFARQLDAPGQVALALLATGLFCAISSAVYLLNDCADVDRDRAHPVKRHRPIASGAVPVPVARRVSVVLALVALAGGALVSPALAGCLAGYFAMNIAYTFVLKHVGWLDVAVIALGFMVRVLAGAFAIDVAISNWLLLCTFLLALYLGLGKRRHELLTTDETEQRRSLRHYRPKTVAAAMIGTAIATACAYSAYALSEHAASMFGTALMPATVPFIVVGVGRFYQLTSADDLRSPTERIVRDAPFVANILGWGALVVYLIYLQ